MTPFPPSGGSAIVPVVGAAPKVQTTSMKNGDNRGVVGEVVCVLGTTVPGMMGSLPRPLPIGVTCALVC